MPKSSRMGYGRRAGVVAIFLALAVSACSGSNAPPLSSAPAVAPGVYRLVAGDRLRVVTYGERDLSADVVVGSDGAINMPLIGAVPAAGLTPQELQDKLVAAYSAGYLRNPQILVDVTNIRPFYVIGEVNRPGEYPAAPGLTIASAIAKASGYSYRADKKKVFIRRNGSEQEYVADPNKPDLIQPGDIIRVGERYF